MKKFSMYIEIVFSLCLFVFNGCGLDVYYVLKAPATSYGTSSINSSNCSTNTSFQIAYFEFAVNNTGNEDQSVYLGTKVYYRIYSNYSDLISANSTLDSLATSTNATASADNMINTQKFCELQIAADTNNDGKKLVKLTTSVLFQKAGSDQRIYIRLTNYNEDYSSCIKIDSNYLMYNVSTASYGYYATLSEGIANGYCKVVPVRIAGDSSNCYDFDFGREKSYSTSSDKKVVPKDGDSDVKYGSIPYEHIWYISMYAVAFGTDYGTFTDYYSPVLNLGSVAISDAETAN